MSKSDIALPPSNPEAEMSVLGSMVLDVQVAKELSRDMDREDFFTPGHGILFDAICGVSESGQVDVVLLRERLIADESLQDVGGWDYVIQVCNFVPSPANYRRYAKIVKDKRFQRDMKTVADKLRSASFDANFETNEDRMALIEESFKGIRDSFSRVNRISPSIGDIMRQVDAELCDTFTLGNTAKAFTTGFPSLDAHVSGFFPGDQVIIGGWTGDGKTAFVGESMVKAAAMQGTVSLFNSGEMKSCDVVRRIIQSRSGVSVGRMRRGDFDGNDYQGMSDVMEEHYKLPVYIEDKLMKPDQLYAKAIRIKREHGRIDRIALDYIQMLGKFTRRGDVGEMDSMMYEYKDMAKELGCTTLLLSQFNTESQKDARPPRLGDLKGTGGIAASADWVLLLHRPNPIKHGRESASCYVAKARFGPVGKVALDFIPDRATWVEPGEEI